MTLKSKALLFVPLWPVLALTVNFSATQAIADIVGGDDVSVSDPIEKSVGALYRQTSTGATLCTATLIAKDMALTAAHCVEQGTDNMFLILGPSIKTNHEGALKVLGAEIPRAWKETHTNESDFGDIAVIRFEGKIPKGYKSAPLAPKTLKVEAGEVVMLAGYGITNAKTHEGAGALRKTQVKIVRPDFGQTEMIFNQSQGSGACHGDSGGPAFVEKNGKMILLGVTNRSYPNSATDDCKHEVVYTKVMPYRDWIKTSEEELRKAR